MKANNYIYIIIILFILSILFSKISNPLTSLFLSIIFLIILGIYFLYEKLSIKNKLKKEKDLKEQKRLFEENKKKEEYERILKEKYPEDNYKSKNRVTRYINQRKRVQINKELIPQNRESRGNYNQPIKILQNSKVIEKKHYS